MADHPWEIGAAQVAVIGAGPAGIAAAVRAAESGSSVVLIDEGMRPGGQIWRHIQRSALPRLGRRWLDRLDRSPVQVLCGSSVIGFGAGLGLTVQNRARAGVIAPRRVIIATGAKERFLPFPGWTLPNVLGIGGAQALCKAGASFQDLRIVIAGSGPLLPAVAAMLTRRGARVALVAEQATAGRMLGFGISLLLSPGKIMQAVAYRGQFPRTRYRTGTWVTAASGEDRVREVTLTDGRRRWAEPCDVLCTGYGLVPNTEVAQQLGCTVQDGRVVTDEWQRTTLPEVYCAGEAVGIGGVEAALLEGEIAGLAATERSGEISRRFTSRVRHRFFVQHLERAFALREELRTLPDADTIVCRCEDVPYGSLNPGWSSRQAKLYTRAGMGSCQGRVCGPAQEYLFGWEPVNVRPPSAPASVGTLAHARTGR